MEALAISMEELLINDEFPYTSASIKSVFSATTINDKYHNFRNNDEVNEVSAINNDNISITYYNHSNIFNNTINEIEKYKKLANWLGLLLCKMYR